MELSEKCLKDFFKTLRKVKSQWDSLVQQAERPLVALKNQTEQLQLVTCANLDYEFSSRFPEIKDRLSSKILTGIEEEMVSLKRIVNKMSAHAEELRNKYLAVEQAYYKMTGEEKEDFNPLRPPLVDLLEHSLDAYRLYQSSLVLKQISLDTADYMESKSITNIEKSFIEDRLKKEHILYILSLTQLYEES